MDIRIIKDIRYYELKPEDYQGKFDGILGNVYQNTPDSIYIGQRIARKLNELGFISGEFDHIYLNLSPRLQDGEIIESNVFLDKKIRHFNCGIKPFDFNNLTDEEKDLKIKSLTFQVLHLIYKNDDLKIQTINDVKDLIDKYGNRLIIKYKTKETSNYRIDLSFQIQPDNDKSKLIIEYTNKKDNNILNGTLDILDYEDLYSLVDNVSLKEDFVIFQPKKSYHAELVAKRYDKPLNGIEIKRMTKK
jgi:hypothetical protein